LSPLVVTQLPKNTFRLYKEKQQESGADITQLKPPHINRLMKPWNFCWPIVKAPVALNEM